MAKKINKKKEVSVGGLAVKVDSLVVKTDDLAKSIDDLAVITGRGFNDVYKKLDRLETGVNLIGKKVDNLDKRVARIEKDIVRINDILEKNTTSLKRLDEERIFTLSYAKRLEHEIEKIKTHLKIA